MKLPKPDKPERKRIVFDLVKYTAKSETFVDLYKNPYKYGLIFPYLCRKIYFSQEENNVTVFSRLFPVN
jgi:hypothetical protein